MLNEPKGGARETGRPTPAEALDLLIAGRIGLHELPPLLFAAYCLGHDDGRTSRQAEVDRLDAECDRLYAIAVDPGRPARTVAQLLERQRVHDYRRKTA